MRINQDSREIVCSVVYCGPEGSGKSTNLSQLLTIAPSDSVGPVQIMGAAAEQRGYETLSLILGDVEGFRCIFELHAAPGLSSARSIRRDLLREADGVVFVADSRRENIDENIEAMNDLYALLREVEATDDIPTVFQFSHQEAPSALPTDQLSPLLNHRQVPAFPAAASTGAGVADTAKAIAEAVIDRIEGSGMLSNVPDTGAPTADGDGPWLLTCYNCSSMLEVPRADPGDIYSCGSCGAPLEVVDPDRGETRAPPPPGASGNYLAKHSSRITAVKDDSGAQPQSVGAMPDSPLSPASGNQVLGPLAPKPLSGETISFTPTSNPVIGQTPAGGSPIVAAGSTPSGTNSALDASPSGNNVVIPDGDFPLAGYQSQALLDEHLIGRRFRITEPSRQRVLRGLVINPPVMRQPGYQDQIEPDLKLAAKVRHANILPLVGLKWADGTPVILSQGATEHEPLNHVLARRKTLQPPQVMAIARQIALALEEAARSGVVHGWLRPEVVLLDGNGGVLLDELGVPKPHAFLLRESLGASAATEHYLAPEHLDRGSPSDVRTDMFLLGSLIFHMITGAGLVTGYSAHEALHKASASGTRSVRSVKPDIGRDLDAFVARLTAVERKDRFQNWREAIEALDRVRTGSGRTMQLTKAIPRSGEARRTTAGADARRTAGGAAGRRTGNAPAGGAARRTTGGQGMTGSYARGRTTASDGPRNNASRATSNDSGGGGKAVLVLLLLGGLAVGGIFAYRHFERQRTPVVPPSTPDNEPPTPDGEAPPSAPPSQPGQTGDENASPTTSQPSTLPSDTTGDGPVSPAGDQPASDLAAAIAAADAAIAAYSATPNDQQLLTEARSAVNRVREQDRNAWGPVKDRLDAAVQQAPTASPAVNERLTETTAAVDQLLSDQRYGAARALVLGQIADQTLQAPLLSRISAAHSSARTSLQSQVLQATDEAAALQLLEPVFDRWGMEGDRDWAQALLTSVRARAETEAPPERTGGAAETDPGEPMSPGGFPLQLIRSDALLDQALLGGDRHTAERIVGGLDATSTIAQAINAKYRLWTQSHSVINQAIETRGPRLRVQSPLSSERWDVVAVDPERLRMRQPSGAEVQLAWAEFEPSNLADLFVGLGAGTQATGGELATAAAGALVCGEMAQASLLSAKAANAGSEFADDLDLLVSMRRDRSAVILLDHAEEAIAANDPAALADVIAELQRENRAVEGRLDQHIAELETIRSQILSGERTGGSLADAVDFSSPDHLNAFPSKRGSWMVAGGSLTNTGPAILSRNDLGNARSVEVALTIAEASGGVSLDFRGVRLVADVAAGTVTLFAGATQIGPEPFPLLAHTGYTIHLGLNQDQSRVTAEINTALSLEIAPEALTSSFALSADTGSRIAVDHFQINRLAAGDQAGGAAGVDRALQDRLRQATGLEPFGGAFKDPASPAIELPRVAGGRSGVGMALRESVVGMRFAISAGDGMVALGLAEVVNGVVATPLATIIPPSHGEPPLDVVANWAGDRFQITITQAGADPVVIEGDPPQRASHFVILAEGSATISTTPSPIRRQ